MFGSVGLLLLQLLHPVNRLIPGLNKCLVHRFGNLEILLPKKASTFGIALPRSFVTIAPKLQPSLNACIQRIIASRRISAHQVLNKKAFLFVLLRIGIEQVIDPFDTAGDKVNHRLDRSAAVIERQHETLPGALQQFDRTLHGIEPVFCNSSQLPVYVLQIFTQATQIVRAVEEGIEGRHAPFVGQFEGFGQVDTPIPKSLQPGNQIKQRAHRAIGPVCHWHRPG